jgi:hypothetical protein
MSDDQYTPPRRWATMSDAIAETYSRPAHDQNGAPVVVAGSATIPGLPDTIYPNAAPPPAPPQTRLQRWNTWRATQPHYQGTDQPPKWFE